MNFSKFLVLIIIVSWLKGFSQELQDWNWHYQSGPQDVVLMSMGDVNLQFRKDPKSGFRFVQPTLNQADGKGNYFVTDFAGRLTFITTHGNLHTLIGKKGSGILADLDFIPDKNLLIIPTHRDNTVEAYEVHFPMNS